MLPRVLRSLPVVVLATVGAAQEPAPAAAPAAAPVPPPFELPCDGYQAGLRGRGNFGVLVTGRDSPFAGSYHLAEDVWLPAGTDVRCVADGVVRYSDFSPSWKDQAGHVHWNLGNVIVVEHPLVPAVDGMAAVCSFYVHLGADRRVATGDVVRRGQLLGRIGKDRSEENGLYPAHLHFGLHRGPYLQIPPAWRRELETAARTTGLAVGDGPPLRGEIELRMHDATTVLVEAKAGGARALLSLLVGSTAPGRQPADIMAWCSGYGSRDTVDEWLCPSRWIAAHGASPSPTPRPH